MKSKIKIIFLSVIVILTGCDDKKIKGQFTISCPDRSGQMRYYFETNEFKIDDNNCIHFTSLEDKKEYCICNNYDIER